MDAAREHGVTLFDTAKDRKSTRLNSSHEWISYAVFCLKKKKGGNGVNEPSSRERDYKNMNVTARRSGPGCTRSARRYSRAGCRPRACRALFFFFNDTATTEIYTLSLHDALPISSCTTFWACCCSGVPVGIIS